MKKLNNKKSDYDDLEIGKPDDDLEIGEPIRRDIPLRGRRPPPEDLESPEYFGMKIDKAAISTTLPPLSHPHEKYKPSFLIKAVVIIVISSLSVYFITNYFNSQIPSQDTDVKIFLDNNSYSIGNIVTVTLTNAKQTTTEEVKVSVFNINTKDQINLKMENGTKLGEFIQKFNLATETNEELHYIKVNANDTIMVIYYDTRKINNPPRYANTTAAVKII